MRGFPRRRGREKSKTPELARTGGETRERHVLGGRTFLVVQEGTVEQDLEILALIKQAGLDNTIMAEDEDPDVFALRLFAQAVRNRSVLRLLGCLLVPEEVAKRGQDDPGEAWSTEIGEQTADFLRTLRDPTDKAHVKSLVLSLLVPFVREGISSIWTSTMSSSELIPPNNEEDATRADDTPSGQN